MTAAPVRSDAALRVRRLAFAHPGRTVLEGVDLDLVSGEVLSLLGSNGAGKSTLLRLLLGLLRPDRGEVRLAGRALATYPRSELAQHLAYVPQAHAALFPYTVRDLVLMGRLPVHGMFKAATPRDRAAADLAMEQLGVAHLAARPCTELSGGERQLVLIARAVAQGARFVVLDEPAAGLDYGNQMRLLLRMRLLATQGYAVLQTTHQPEHALLVSTRVALLERGRIVDDGSPRAVVTAAAIERLYGIAVAAFHSEQGHTAFHPLALDPGGRDVPDRPDLGPASPARLSPLSFDS